MNPPERPTSTGGKAHTTDFLSSELKRVIEDIGAANINAICTDTASNMLSAVPKIRDTFPHIYAIKCMSHSVNLLIGDILQLDPLAEVISKVKTLVHWFKSWHVPLHELTVKQKHFCGKSIALALLSNTRWQSHLDSLRAVLNSKFALKSVILKPKIRQRLES